MSLIDGLADYAVIRYSLDHLVFHWLRMCAMTRLRPVPYRIIDSPLSVRMNSPDLNAGKYPPLNHFRGSVKPYTHLYPSVSLLTDFEDVPTYLDWDIGTHGIYISFVVPSRGPASIFGSSRRSSQQTLNATYLPDVIPEQGWTKLEAVESAIRKAGWDGLIDEAMLMSVRLKRYQSRHVTVTWLEYVEWRKMRDTTGDCGVGGNGVQ